MTIEFDEEGLKRELDKVRLDLLEASRESNAKFRVELARVFENIATNIEGMPAGQAAYVLRGIAASLAAD